MNYKMNYILSKERIEILKLADESQRYSGDLVAVMAEEIEKLRNEKQCVWKRKFKNAGWHHVSCTEGYITHPFHQTEKLPEYCHLCGGKIVYKLVLDTLKGI